MLKAFCRFLLLTDWVADQRFGPRLPLRPCPTDLLTYLPELSSLLFACLIGVLFAAAALSPDLSPHFKSWLLSGVYAGVVL